MESVRGRLIAEKPELSASPYKIKPVERMTTHEIKMKLCDVAKNGCER